MKIKVLNLYAGIGGNRKLWPDEDIEVTAVELDENIAAVYKKLFPNDNVIVADAHQYLLENYNRFDFIWASPPCPSHSDIRRCAVHAGHYEPIYPDMKLYEEIIFLNHFAPKDCRWVVENVKPYYDLLIPGKPIGKHIFWSNFIISGINEKDHQIHNDIIGSEEVYGFSVNDTDIENKRRVLRNLVNPKIGKHVFESAFRTKQCRIDQITHD